MVSNYQRLVEKHGVKEARRINLEKTKAYRERNLDSERERCAAYYREYNKSSGTRSMGDLQGTGVTYVNPELALLAWSTDIPSGQLAEQFGVTSSYVTQLRSGSMGKPVIRSILEAAKNLKAKGFKL